MILYRFLLYAKGPANLGIALSPCQKIEYLFSSYCKGRVELLTKRYTGRVSNPSTDMVISLTCNAGVIDSFIAVD